MSPTSSKLIPTQMAEEVAPSATRLQGTVRWGKGNEGDGGGGWGGGRPHRGVSAPVAEVRQLGFQGPSMQSELCDLRGSCH